MKKGKWESNVEALTRLLIEAGEEFRQEHEFPALVDRAAERLAPLLAKRGVLVPSVIAQYGNAEFGLEATTNEDYLIASLERVAKGEAP